MTVDLSDLSRSYPFLHLSRKFGVSYEVILRFAELYDAGVLRPPPQWEPNTECVFAVHRVCTAPWRWQFPPRGRGL